MINVQIRNAVYWAHKNQFPLWAHVNGTLAQTNTLEALREQQASDKQDKQYKPVRDVMIHFTTPTKKQIEDPTQFDGNNTGATFLVNNFYYYYQPLCQQILGPGADPANMYPAKWAADSKIHFGLHSDTTVTPPSPLFSMWVATTREVQSPSWMASITDDDPCWKGIGEQGGQAITRFQAMKAYTSDAAWLYGRDGTEEINRGIDIGMLKRGFAGDLVVLSADPLNPATDLSKINVLYTVHNGNIVYDYDDEKKQAEKSHLPFHLPAWPK